MATGLLSAEKMNETGHIVVFDGDNSYVASKWAGDVNMLRRQDGNFMLDLWVPPPAVAQGLGFAKQP